MNKFRLSGEELCLEAAPGVGVARVTEVVFGDECRNRWGRWREVTSELLGDDHAGTARRERAREGVGADSDVVEVRVDDVAEVAARLDEQQVNQRYVGRAATEAEVLTDGRETILDAEDVAEGGCLLYTSPSPRDQRGSRMPSSA